MNIYNEYIFYGIIVFALVLLRFPRINKYFRIVNTLIHEMGHAITALITGGSVVKINLFNDLSGECITQSKGKISRFLISIMGYLAPPIVAMLFFYFINQQKYNYIFWILSVTSTLALLLFVRNSYGIIWLILFIIINAILLYFKINWLQYIISVFFSAILLLESFISCLQLFLISFKTPDKAGDASNLQEIAILPSILWSLFFLLFSLFLAYKTIISFFPLLF